MAVPHMLTDVIFARSSEGAVRDDTCMPGYAKSVACLHMSCEVGTQSEASCAITALEGLCMRLQVLASLKSVINASVLSRELTCSALRFYNA